MIRHHRLPNMPLLIILMMRHLKPSELLEHAHPLKVRGNHQISDGQLLAADKGSLHKVLEQELYVHEHTVLAELLLVLVLVEKHWVERPGEHFVGKEGDVAGVVGSGEVLGVDREDVASRDPLTERLINILQTVLGSPDRLMPMNNRRHYPSKLLKL